jgi:hypothetical protein
MKKKTAGRPNRNVKVVQLNTRVSEEHRNKINRLAAERKWTVRVSVESIIDYFFATGGDKK